MPARGMRCSRKRPHALDGTIHRRRERERDRNEVEAVEPRRRGPRQAAAPRDGRFRVVAAPERTVRASAGKAPRGPTAEQLRDIRVAVLDRAVNEGLVPADQCQGWARLLEADFSGAFDQLREMGERRRARLAAAAPRPPREGEAIIADAAREGRIPESRRGYWLARLREAPEEVERLMTAAPEAGGLVALPIGAASTLVAGGGGVGAPCRVRGDFHQRSRSARVRSTGAAGADRRQVVSALSGFDDLERAALAGAVAGAAPLLERDRQALARAMAWLARVPADELVAAVAEREPRREVRAAAFTLGRAARSIALLRGSAEAVALIGDAADERGVGREHALRAALLGVIQQTTPSIAAERRDAADGPPRGSAHGG
jgi:hypothetical protein